MMVVRISMRVGSLEAIDETVETVRGILVGAILDLDTDLRDTSPVKDGFFVNSWQSQHDGQPEPVEGFNSTSRGGSDPAVIAAGIGGTVSLVNTAVYGPRLADGYSPQAPAGWVEGCASRLQDHVDRHAMMARGGR